MRPNLQFPADLVTFTEEILNGKLYLLCSYWENIEWLVISFRILKNTLKRFDKVQMKAFK